MKNPVSRAQIPVLAVLALLALSCCSSRPGHEGVPGPGDEAAPAANPGDQNMAGPDEPAEGAAARLSAGDELAAAMSEMKEALGKDFAVRGRFPFAVGSDLPEDDLDRYVEKTLIAAYEAFYAQFFEKRPDRVMKVYLFWGARSYRDNAKRLFGGDPGSPYGYYSPSRRSLIMNIQTGGGTLIHELVHALMHYDFDESPTWFDEGLASLFEQSSIAHGRILGLENWRLPILKKGIAEGRTLPLRKLMSTDRAGFLDGESSLHYAQARYFVMFLQEEGLLGEFYKTYRAAFREDPTGVGTAEKVTGKSIEKLEKEMLAWLETLSWK